MHASFLKVKHHRIPTTMTGYTYNPKEEKWGNSYYATEANILSAQ
jgi:hypothetical protein